MRRGLKAIALLQISMCLVGQQIHKVSLVTTLQGHLVNKSLEVPWAALRDDTKSTGT